MGAYSPSYGFEKEQNENEEIYKMINESGANVVLVGVGCPKQEKWIFTHKDKMPEVDIWMALGATIDFEAGNIKACSQNIPNLGDGMVLSLPERTQATVQALFYR